MSKPILLTDKQILALAKQIHEEKMIQQVIETMRQDGSRYLDNPLPISRRINLDTWSMNSVIICNRNPLF